MSERRPCPDQTGHHHQHDERSHPAEDDHVSTLIDGFFAGRTRHMQPIDGAIDSLLAIAASADVVMLTNLPHSAGDDRRANLGDLGLPFPVITNAGPKGPAIKHLAAQMAGPVVFIDDSPYFISSSHEHAPDVHLIHFMHDERFSRHVPVADYVSLRTHSWEEAKPHSLAFFSTSEAYKANSSLTTLKPKK